MKMQIELTKTLSKAIEEQWQVHVRRGEAELVRTITIRTGLPIPQLNEQLAGAAGEAVRLMLGAHGGPVT